MAGLFCPAKIKKEFFFCKNEARKLLKTKDICGKNSQNEPETKLAKLLKIRNGRKNEAKPQAPRSSMTARATAG